MRRSSPPVCPQCAKNDRVKTVAEIYRKGTEGDRLASRLAAKTAGARQLAISAGELRELTARLSPPTPLNDPKARMLHPDYAIGAFSVALPVFLIGILASRAILLAPLALVVGGFYAFYFTRRKSLISRFEQRRLARQESLRRSERAIGRWLSACYCDRDHVFFLAGRPAVMSLDQLAQMLGH